MSTLFSHFFPKINEIVPQNAEFTEVLESIAVKPKKLYFYGKIPQNRVKSVAIVGTRKPTNYGANIAKKLSYELAKQGVVIISGLAYGIDSIAHRGALEANGVTIGVLGTPIDQIYPKAHLGLAREVVESGGCIMSELMEGAEFYPKVSFLERNRIISGLADVVIVVEAAERSGSLNTAAHALEQGREVFAVPGDVTRPTSRGCNRLIRQGAIPCLGTEDVMEVLFPERVKKVKARQASLPIGDNEMETKILQAICRGLQDGEKILAETKLGVAEFSQQVTLLEIKGRVRSLGMNRWALK